MNNLRHITDDKQAILFDLDGTLVDSMWMWADIDEKYLGKFGLSVPDNLQKELDGMGFTETAVYFKQRFHLPDTVEQIKADWNAMAEEFYARTAEPKEGVISFVREMKRQGKAMALASSNSRQLCSVCLKRLGLTDCIETVITACDVGRGKPQPDIYLAAAAALNTAPQHCLVFEDIPMGILAGRRAGMAVCAVRDSYAMDQEHEIRRMANWYISDFRQVLEGTQENLGENRSFECRS